MKNTVSLEDFVPVILKTAKSLKKRGPPSAIYVYKLDHRRSISFTFEVSQMFPPFAFPRSFNAIVTINGLPFNAKDHEGTLKLYVNIYDVVIPSHCRIIVESITCTKGNPASVNRNALLQRLESAWSKGCS